MARSEWDTHEHRTEAMHRLLDYLEERQHEDGSTVALEMSETMLNRVAEELDLVGRIRTAVKDAAQDGYADVFNFPDFILTERGEAPTGYQESILALDKVAMGARKRGA